jgi:hypothetical protein
MRFPTYWANVSSPSSGYNVQNTLYANPDRSGGGGLGYDATPQGVTNK